MYFSLKPFPKTKIYQIMNFIAIKSEKGRSYILKVYKLGSNGATLLFDIRRQYGGHRGEESEAFRALCQAGHISKRKQSQIINNGDTVDYYTHRYIKTYNIRVQVL